MFFVPIHMKVLSSLRKRTANGVSVWCFCYDAEMQRHYAVGGEDLRVIAAIDRKHLKQIFNNFLSYGYTRKLAKPKAAPKKQKMLVADPWASQLPLDEQLALANL